MANITVLENLGECTSIGYTAASETKLNTTRLQLPVDQILNKQRISSQWAKCWLTDLTKIMFCKLEPLQMKAFSALESESTQDPYYGEI